jgi:hypothetical protein
MEESEISKIIAIDGHEYFIRTTDHTDMIFYHIHTKDGHELCVISINDEGQWEANCAMDEDLIKKIGTEIESKEL